MKSGTLMQNILSVENHTIYVTRVYFQFFNDSESVYELKINFLLPFKLFTEKNGSITMNHIGKQFKIIQYLYLTKNNAISIII